MKPKLSRILFALSLVVFVLMSAEQLRAQDTVGPGETYEGNDEKDREPLYSPGEQLDQHHKVQSSTLLKDSAAFSPKSTQRAFKPENAKSEAKQASSDDSILSFNFLYYIIQKYKLQDIVD